MAYAHKFVYPLKDLENERVRLEQFDYERAEHQGIIDLMCQHPELHRHFPRPGWTERAHFEAWYAERVSSTDTACLFAVYNTAVSPPAPAGLIGLIHTDAVNEAAELGFVYVLPDWQRTHVLTNAAGLLMQYTLDVLKLRRLYWLASSENAASRRAAERLGFKFEGISRWCLKMAEGKREEDGHRRGNEKRLGIHVVTLALCWDDWEEENGVREALVKQMQRTA